MSRSPPYVKRETHFHPPLWFCVLLRVFSFFLSFFFLLAPLAERNACFASQATVKYRFLNGSMINHPNPAALVPSAVVDACSNALLQVRRLFSFSLHGACVVPHPNSSLAMLAMVGRSPHHRLTTP